MNLTPKDVNLSFFREMFVNYDHVFFIDIKDIKNVYFKHRNDKFEAIIEIEADIPQEVFHPNFIVYLLVKIDNILSDRFDNYLKYMLDEYNRNDDKHLFKVTLLFRY